MAKRGIDIALLEKAQKAKEPYIPHYNKNIWVDDETVITSMRLYNIEDKVQELTNVINQEMGVKVTDSDADEIISFIIGQTY